MNKRRIIPVSLITQVRKHIAFNFSNPVVYNKRQIYNSVGFHADMSSIFNNFKGAIS